MSDPQKELEQQVSECLTHLYNINLLKDQVLVQQLVPAAQGSERPHVFRLEVMRLIESLRPLGEVDLYSKPARVYNILQLRYVEGQTHAEVADQLGLSESQYFREHRRALEAITTVIGDRLQKKGTVHADITFHSEWQRARDQSHYVASDLGNILEGARETAQSLARMRQVAVEIEVRLCTSPPNLPAIGLRQIAILLISQLLIHARAGSQLVIMGDSAGKNICIEFRLNRLEISPQDLIAHLEQHEALAQLASSLNACLQYIGDVSEGFGIALDLAINERQVLIIDDNPDAISLLRRFLSEHDYPCLEAGTAESGIQLARTQHPWLIILDVMMPDTDGWEVLQNLKHHPDTRAIPVLICSVLDIPEVALSLGADGYLKKPPHPPDLFNLLAQWEK